MGEDASSIIPVAVQQQAGGRAAADEEQEPWAKSVEGVLLCIIVTDRRSGQKSVVVRSA